MMAELRRLFAALKTEIALPGNTRLWATAQQRHPVLNRVATIHAVLAILGDPGNKALRYKACVRACLKMYSSSGKRHFP